MKPVPIESAPHSLYSFREELMNAISHGVGLIIALTGLVLLLQKAQGSTQLVAVSVYGGTLVLMFLASTIYHSVSHLPTKKTLKLLDHCSIYLLIAGTYTPLLLIALDGWVSWSGLIIIWSLAVAGIGFKLLTGSRFPKVSVLTYMAMGWFAVFLAYPLIQNVPNMGLWLLLGGGLCFSLGVIFYVAKHKQYTHAIWHLFVIGGCSCHYFSVYQYVI